MTAEQVLRCAVLKQYRELTYEELSFIWRTRRLPYLPVWRDGTQYLITKINSPENIKAIEEETWKQSMARSSGMPSGEDRVRVTIRVDSTGW